MSAVYSLHTSPTLRSPVAQIAGCPAGPERRNSDDVTRPLTKREASRPKGRADNMIATMPELEQQTQEVKLDESVVWAE